MALNAIRSTATVLSGTTVVQPNIPLQNGLFVALGAGETQLIAPGTWFAAPGQYTFVEAWDSIAQIWRPVKSLAGIGGAIQIESDGGSYRFANRTGTQIGAIVTAAGSGYVAATPPTVTASSGASVWKAVVGGAISSTITITAGGTNYQFPPILVPTGMQAAVAGQPFVPPSAVCTISAGAINAVTVIDQGAGLLAAPGWLIVNDPRDVKGSGAVLTSTLTGAGTITAVLNLDQGTPLTAVPTLSFSSGAATASSIMVATSTAITFAGASNAGNGNFALIPGSGTPPASVLVNPTIQNGLFVPRMGYTGSSTSATPTTTVIIDGGLQQQYNAVTITPVLVLNSNGTISAATTLGTNTFGGVSDVSWLIPA